MASGEGGVWFIDSNGRTTIGRFDPDVRAVELGVRLPDHTTPIAMTTAPGNLWVLNYDGSLTRAEIR